MSKRILFVGPISPPITGPGVKNAEMLNVFRKHFDVSVINTLEKWTIWWLVKNLYQIFFSRVLIVSVSKKGRYVYSTLNFISGFLIKRNSYLFAAGGSLDHEISNLPFFIKRLYVIFLKNYTQIYVESFELVDRLNNLGIFNCSYLPNGRFDRGYHYKVKANATLKLVFLSKVREGKGILLLLEAMKSCRDQGLKVELDIYGVIDNDLAFTRQFNNGLKSASEFVFYRGICDFDAVQRTLSDYDAFVFPSLLPEGMPGVIVEAMTVGIPIISTEFRCLNEILEDGKSCLVFDKNVVSLVNSIVKITDETTRVDLSKESRKLATDFDLEFILKDLLDAINMGE